MNPPPPHFQQDEIDPSKLAFLPQQQSKSQARVVPSYLQNEVQCELCAYNYDLSERVPMMLCPSQHNCCLLCVKEIIMRKKQCPFCRRAINVEYIQKNRMVCRILEQVARKNGKEIVINENPEKQFIEQRNTYVNVNNVSDHSIALFLQPDQLNNYIAIAQIPIDNNQNQSLGSKICHRIELSNPLFCFMYFLTMIYTSPFSICQMVYASKYKGEDMQCLEKDYGVGMSLRQWLLSSAIIGTSMFGVSLMIMFMKVLCPMKKKFTECLAILNIVGFLLKFLGYNIVGFVVYGHLDQDGFENCSGSLVAYMESLLIIQIVIVCGLCSLFSRRR